MTDRIIRAPWTAEQVTALNAFQQRGGMHPFTCGGDHAPGSPALVAYADGWRCPQPYGEACDYRQDWAHAFMAAVPAVPAGQAPATDRATPSRRAGLRDEIVKALGRIKTIPPVAHRQEQADHVLAVLYREWPWLRAEAEDADVLPAPAGRATVLEEAAQRLYTALFPAVYADLGQKAAEGVNRAVSELRRLAAAPAAVHVCKPGATVYHCLTSGQTESDCHGGFDTCCDRPDLHQPAALPAQTDGETAGCDVEFEAGGQCTKAAGHRTPRNQDPHTPPAAEEVVHGCPPDGSGLTPCCGRTPFELPLTDRISSEAPVTCPGPEQPATGAHQPKEA